MNPVKVRNDPSNLEANGTPENFYQVNHHKRLVVLNFYLIQELKIVQLNYNLTFWDLVMKKIIFR